jgi:hypothetical protein
MKMDVTAVIKVGAAVFCLDVGLELLRLGEIFAAQMALRSASVRIGRTAVGPVNIQVSWSQKTLSTKKCTEISQWFVNDA